MMSKMEEDGRTAQRSTLGTRDRSASARRAEGRLGRTRKNRTPVLGVKPGGRPVSDITQRQRKALHAGGGSEQPKPENVESLTDYRPCEMKYEVSLSFSGQAGAVMSELMTNLHVDTPNDLAKRAIALLLSAQGKEILLRDPKTGGVRAVEA
jgi:hypothetical protein